ncbi:hypothetical protein QBC35DRAFT_503898 [Podospora australis]|uniref:Uncharacterized protein n=1 Tax=Podospora australis TaxID=1536484 RepID=A0AAN7AFH3_9PEZI|nr:hypothetical protein QBC35DRAFT_503898 [Podospora australis]
MVNFGNHTFRKGLNGQESPHIPPRHIWPLSRVDEIDRKFWRAKLGGTHHHQQLYFRNIQHQHTHNIRLSIFFFLSFFLFFSRNRLCFWDLDYTQFFFRLEEEEGGGTIPYYFQTNTTPHPITYTTFLFFLLSVYHFLFASCFRVESIGVFKDTGRGSKDLARFYGILSGRFLVYMVSCGFFRAGYKTDFLGWWVGLGF